MSFLGVSSATRALGSAIIRAVESLRAGFRGLTWHLVLDSRAIRRVHLVPGYDVDLHMKGDIARIIYSQQPLLERGRSFEYDVLSLMADRLQLGSACIDIGANIGAHALLAATVVGEEGLVVAFEPNPASFDTLVANSRANNLSNIRYVRRAISDVESVERLVEIDAQGGGDAYAHLEPIDLDHDASQAHGAGLEVEVSRLDDYLDKHPFAQPLDLIKIDIEGAELLALRGASRTLQTLRPLIIFEAYEEYCHRYGYSVIELLEYVRSFDYRLTQIEPHQWLASPLVN